MSGVATAIAVGTTAYGAHEAGKQADKAAGAARYGAELSAQGEREALEYQKEVDKKPLLYRDEALTGLRDVYMGDQQAQQDMIDRAMGSPLYKSMMGGMETGQEAVLQNQAMQGGWRSGDAKMNMMDYTTRTSQNALKAAYGEQLAGMESFTNPNLNTGGIAGSYGNIGDTLGSGYVAGAQAEQAGQQGKWDAITGAVNIGLQGYNTYLDNKGATPPPAKIPYVSDAEYLASDIRLKENIRQVGDYLGYKIYEWDWNEIAKKFFGLTGKSNGVMAHEVYEKNPDAIKVEDGILLVNYGAIGV